MTSLPPVTLTYEEFEDLHARLSAADNANFALGNALAILKRAAQAVEAAVGDEQREEALAELIEAIPCDDCFQAPCVCP